MIMDYVLFGIQYTFRNKGYVERGTSIKVKTFQLTDLFHPQPKILTEYVAMLSLNCILLIIINTFRTNWVGDWVGLSLQLFSNSVSTAAIM
jgi:hypothetical protein